VADFIVSRQQALEYASFPGLLFLNASYFPTRKRQKATALAVK
jgi:hypothetical protein